MSVFVFLAESAYCSEHKHRMMGDWAEGTLYTMWSHIVHVLYSKLKGFSPQFQTFDIEKNPTLIRFPNRSYMTIEIIRASLSWVPLRIQNLPMRYTYIHGYPTCQGVPYYIGMRSALFASLSWLLFCILLQASPVVAISCTRRNVAAVRREMDLAALSQHQSQPGVCTYRVG